jgi:hypothetical protein
VRDIARHFLRILRQVGASGHVAHRAVGARTECHRAFGDAVVVIGQADRERFEQRMERRELRALDVPVRDLDLAVQIQSVGEPLIERYLLWPALPADDLA